ncbi:hypothetical protein TL16_g08437 [Triparma laevis f. inornata]|uniref:Phosphatidylinositol-3,4,5-trisphosphate 3-phosphatase n=1 Tax=Triparma laevis f. inornata TaxID=1714386 RepID=A0A9W7AYA9_9STRA|nr:hypothetical protein TL16_g08437 [Triparma laevis f. inornata]
MSNPMLDKSIMVDVEMGDAVNKSVRDLRTLSEEIQQQKNTKDIRQYTLREKLYNWVNSIHVQAILVICILIDLSILIYEQSHPEHDHENATVAHTTLVILLIFFAEVLIKLAVYGPYLFVKDPFNIFDAVVVLLSLIFTIAEIFSLAGGVIALRTARNLYKVLKALRTVRSIRFLYMHMKQMQGSARHLVGRNKQRYVDLNNQFDLDLCYINEPQNLIVMSVPATGKLALFRNPIWEVKRFFEVKHKDAYRIYNVCPEHPYPDWTEDQSIRKYAVQDHSPPTMDTFISCLNDASTYMSQNDGKNTIAVHCRGGKGRSGSLCCAWLLFSKECATAEQALARFAVTRTESRMEGSLQGVETPSQKRYIYQLDQLLRKQNRYHGSNSPLIVPQQKKIMLKSLVLENLFSKPAEVTKLGALVCTISQQGRIIYTSPGVLHEILSNRPSFDLHETKVSGDVQVSVYIQSKMTLSQKVAKSGKEKGILFTFFFHTAFTSNNNLNMEMKMIDKAVKNKKMVKVIKKPYLETGSAVLSF